MRLKKNDAFTVLELLIVIAILSLLFSVAYVAVNSSLRNARDSARLVEFKAMKQALELFYEDNGHYPCHGTQVSTNPGFLSELVPGYIDREPGDPINDPAHIYGYHSFKSETNGPCGQSYMIEIEYETKSYCNDIAGWDVTYHEPSRPNHCHVFYPEPELPSTCAPCGGSGTSDFRASPSNCCIGGVLPAIIDP